MKYVRQQIVDFTSSTIPDLFPIWSSTTTYNTEALPLTSVSTARYGSYTWRTVVDGNLNNTPSETSDVWIRNGVSNRHAMIDLRSTTRSISVGADMVVEFERLYTMDTLVIGYYSAETVTIEQIDDTGAETVILRTEVISQSPNENVEDYYTYIYSPYSLETDRNVYLEIFPTGNKIRVTFATSAGIPDVSCGFMTCGESVDMGQTKSDISFSYNSYSTKNVDTFGIIKVTKRAISELVDFNTSFVRQLMPSQRRKIKKIYDEIVVFIVDDSGSEEQEGIVTLGTIEMAKPILNTMDKAVVAWSVSEII